MAVSVFSLAKFRLKIQLLATLGRGILQKPREILSLKIDAMTKTPSIDDFLKPNKILCEVVGMMPTRIQDLSMPRRCSVYFRIIFAVVAINTVFVPEILDIAVNWGDIGILTSVGCVTTTVGQVLFKIVYLLWRRETATRMYDMIKDLWKISDAPEDKETIEKYARHAQIFTVVFFAFGFSNNITFTIAAIFNLIEMRKNHNNETDYINGLPFDVWYGADPLSWPDFQIAFGCQSLAAVICCVSIVGLDACMMTLVLHVCGQFLLIQSWFRKIGAAIHRQREGATGGNVARLLTAEIREDIGRSVEHHQRMLLIAEEVDELLSPVIFVQFVTSGVEICLSGFAVTTAGASNGDVLKFSCYLVTMVLQLVVWCWPGELLNRESLGVGDTVYFDLEWYELPGELRTDMCLVIARSQKQCGITAMNFQTMSLKTLGSIFNTAASYFTLLRQMQMNDN